ncbi:TrbI/VirB10 family protein [Stenotrophomonas sp.]|uniref:TrbI/VirB10 family protein n=1 Tax=Stenotrophomonas sp. TaxID=69392 RepID=UPI0028A2C4F7|nr:TrbI/VirB10 family protein [Stenotrophomonas sp.]
MNQIPPNDQAVPDPAPQAQPQPAVNPYVRRDYATDPGLDGEAPYLRADDVQRLNRKALVFLAAIVIALAALAAWIFSGGLSSGEQVQVKQPSEQVVIPAAPRDLPELPPAQPVVQAPPMEELPPLPVVDDSQHGSMMPGMDSMQPREMTLLERRMLDANGEAGDSSGGPAAAGLMPGMAQAAGAGGAGAPADGPTSAQPLYKPSTLLLRGTYIRCVLQARVISDFPGYTSCIVTEPVYSVDGKRLLLPRGSKVQGAYGADGIIGDRVAIVWDRITTPTGLDINMRSPGVDMLGSAGNAGHYSAHWGQRIASSLLISILADAFKYAAAENGPKETSIVNGAVVQNPYESATARTMERMANLAMERNMSRPPTVTINQGTIVNVYVARDVDFSAVIR